MKTPGFKRAYQRGVGAIIVVVVVTAVVVIGWTAWKLYQAVSKIGQTTSQRIQRAAEEGTSNVLEQVQAEFPQTPYVIVSLETNVTTTFEPFGSPTVERVWIERSTNLVRWERVKLLNPGETWSDPTPPWPAGFYRRTRE